MPGILLMEALYPINGRRFIKTFCTALLNAWRKKRSGYSGGYRGIVAARFPAVRSTFCENEKCR